MLDRLKVIIVAIIVSFGLVAGAGSAFASAPSGTAPCHDMMSAADWTGALPPMSDCDGGMAHKSCAVHAAFVAILAPAPVSAGIDAALRDWTVLPPAAVLGGHIPPETPPPIALR